jgi:uncharacterized protein (DUF58 family)
MMNRRVITWRPAPRIGRLAAAAVIAIGAAIVTRHAGFLLLAAPALGALAVTARRGGPAEMTIAVEVSASRCFEGEEVGISVTLTSPVVLDEISFQLEVAPTVALVSPAAAQIAVGETSACGEWVVRPGRWGRRTPGVVHVRCRSGGGTWQASIAEPCAAMEIFPHAPPAGAQLVPADLLRRIGDHAARTAGAGVEFSSIRGYRPGDRLRDVNWAVSSRRGDLHVNERSALRAADVVLVVDAFSEVGPAGDSTLDVAVRGAAALATAHLRTGDRVGVVALGGVPRWLGPAAGARQFYRIAEMVFDVRHDSVVAPDLDRIPRTALPPGALVVLFSPLLDERALGAVTDLRERGLAVIVIDVLRYEPPALPRSPVSGLAVRLWRLDRVALRRTLARLGVPVLDWDAGASLDAVLSPVRRFPARAGRS